MHDREFTKPHAINFGTAEKPAMYPFEAYVGEFIWGYEKWGEDGWDEAQIRIGETIEGTAPGEPVKLSLDDWEKLREANKAAQLKGPMAHKLRKMHKAIKQASKPSESAEVNAN